MVFSKIKDLVRGVELFYLFVNLFNVKSLQISLIEDSWILIFAFTPSLS